MTAVGRREVPRRSAYRLLTVLAATAVAGLIWVLVVPVIDHPLRVDDLDIGFGAVLSLAFLAGVAGWGTLILLERLTLRARGIWTAVAVLVLLVSFAPITSPGLDVLTRAALSALHLAVAVVVIPMLLHTSPLRRQSGDRSGQ